MTTARLMRKRTKTRRDASVTEMAAEMREVRDAHARELADLSAYLDNVGERDRVAQGLWSETWA